MNPYRRTTLVRRQRNVFLRSPIYERQLNLSRCELMIIVKWPHEFEPAYSPFPGVGMFVRTFPPQFFDMQRAGKASGRPILKHDL
jgi:hypothetical protein